MQDLGVPASSNTLATFINNGGMVVGTYYSSSSGNHGFLWTQTGGVQDWGNLGIQEVSAGGINAFGEVAGSSEVAPGRADLYAGFHWTASGGMRRLPSPFPKYDATASAISSTGEIVGFSLNSVLQQARDSLVYAKPGAQLEPTHREFSADSSNGKQCEQYRPKLWR